MDNNTIKEMSDVISDNVMKQIRHNLSEIKPELIDEITDTVRKSISSQLYDLEARISKLESNTTKKTTDLNKPKTNINISDTTLYSPRWGSSPLSNEQMAKIINKCVEINKKIPNAVDNKKILTPSTMDEILKNHKDFVIGNGWIYYIKHYSSSSYASLYKVKLNGTENQWIPDIKLTRYPKNFDEFYLDGNDLHYTTEDGLPRVIDVEIKPNGAVSNNSKKKSNIFKKLNGKK